ncbi:Carrier protein, mitochondrial [Tilletia horrida]|nr:Carrier protein, mitochondrial [Tilletia horrida]KAK0534718.1 Carrier protein, mitochondrial [Tilletia horrida]KAK0560446.1 Carrier protein, mitochondrial [Tilletia horrida]
MAATAYNVLEEQYELYSSAHQHASGTPSHHGAASSSRVTLDALQRHREPSQLAQDGRRDISGSVDGADEDDGPRRPSVTQAQKAIASLTGAIVTSVFMTPFDVIKTRLQVQGATAAPPFSFEAHHSHLLRPQTSIGPSAPVSSSGSFPPPPRHHLTGLLDGVSKVWRAEGATGLWRGLSPTLVMTVPSQVTYMTCYDQFRTFFLSLDSTASSRRANASALAAHQIPGTSAVTLHSLSASLAAGALARAISATLVTPLELVRTRTQATSSLPSSASLSSIIRTLAQETSRDGPLVLWRGLGSTLWRDVPFSAIYFAGYEGLKRIFTGGGLGEGHASNHSAEFGISFLSGSISGSIAAVLTQPADLIKTRLQTERRVADESSSKGDAASAGARSANSSKAVAAAASRNARNRTTFMVAREIMEKEGVPGLFKGLSPRIAKVAPACGVMIASFEVVGRVLASRES